MLAKWFAGLEVQDTSSELCAFRREVVDSVPMYGDPNIYLPAFVSRQGFKVRQVPVRHVGSPRVPRRELRNWFRYALDLLALFFLTRFTHKPFRFFGGIGAGLLATGGAINLWLAAQKLFLHDSLADRPMLVLATLLMVLGVQMLSLGLIGELIIFANAGGLNDFEVEHVWEADNKAA